MIHWPSLGKAIWDIVKWMLIILVAAVVICFIVILANINSNIFFTLIGVGLLAYLVWIRYLEHSGQIPETDK